jgi:hypothetical protein
MSWKDILKAPIWDMKESIPKDAKVAASHESKISFRDVPPNDNRVKPRGIWYSFGGRENWLDWLKEWGGNTKYSYLIEFEIGGKILKLKTREDYINLITNYPSNDKHYYRPYWGDVKEDYDVIEFHNIDDIREGWPITNDKRNEAEQTLDRMLDGIADSLDVDSGVVLTKEGIKSQKVIAERVSKGRDYKRAMKNRIPAETINAVHGKWTKVKGESMEKVAGAVTTSSAPAMFNVRYSDEKEND